ncbi:hypothetical protein OSC27_09095 [Microbacterium sp. STN6]|uniref:type 1 glutamine amidotransferase n=1 Tax=Microbacterium sp. STN6 TaxID=2995588 RepID=UPI0022609762|nr:hypothetical protein [Microbacterium sp. STN6]MCX7522432.1 hypothetical protein [Microbacterium sp. STN6]
MSGALQLVELYTRHLAINGDMGNTLVLTERARLAGIDVEVTRYNPGDELPEQVDLVTMGSGPSSALRAVADDVARIAGTVRGWVDSNVPFLAIGGGYQLSGTSITGLGAEPIEGLGVFDAVTDAAASRAVTACFVVDSDLGRLVGIENHGSVTALGAGERALGRAVTGRGNDGGGFEGARAHEAIGTHMHGPMLAMNPAVADHMLSVAAAAHGLEYVTNDAHARLDTLAAATRAHLDPSGAVARARGEA